MPSNAVASSRRSFLKLSATAATVAGFRLVTEPMLAHASRRHLSTDRKDVIFLDSNENPLGPSAGAREAIAAITPDGGRYRDDLSDELVKLFRQVPADLVNIIEYNPIDQALFAKPDEQAIQHFLTHLEKNRVNARLRRSRGKDIDAACGQLANKA